MESQHNRVPTPQQQREKILQDATEKLQATVIGFNVHEVDNAELLTIDEVAEALQIKARFVYTILRDYQIPHLRLGPHHGRIRVWKRLFYLWLAARTTVSATQN